MIIFFFIKIKAFPAPYTLIKVVAFNKKFCPLIYSLETLYILDAVTYYNHKLKASLYIFD